MSPVVFSCTYREQDASFYKCFVTRFLGVPSGAKFIDSDVYPGRRKRGLLLKINDLLSPLAAFSDMRDDF